MAVISPFRGIFYNASRVDPNRVVSPPYDVLSPARQDDLYAQDEHNIVRIILNCDTADDTSTSNRHSRAAHCLNEWLADGTLSRDSEPALYEYVQRFHHPLDPATIVERQTLLVALKLEPYENGVVLPHEETHPKAKADRLDLMRATHSNPEPIYGLYEDPGTVIGALLKQAREEAPPILSASSPATEGAPDDEHILYRISDPEAISKIVDFLTPRRIWIADGHHRYETALNYQSERRSDSTGIETHEYDSLLIGLGAFEDPGLLVLPTHRMVRNIPAERLEATLPQLQRYFHMRNMSAADLISWLNEPASGEKRFGMVLAAGAYALTLRDIQQAIAAAPPEHCDAWKRLDVTILQMLVLDRTFGISWKSLAHTPDVTYTRDASEALDLVADGQYQAACLLQQPTVDEVREVASAGDKMPQKSTFFYPKLWSGIILRKLD